MDSSVTIESLSKRYYIGGLHPGYVTFREVFAEVMLAPFQRRRNGGSAREAIWALKNINLEVKEGELVGIIGRNGAGKSTLLKILSRITRPTKGRVRISGRVGSLLEVGTGFHPDLTGRENVFLSGAILGMRKAEIEQKFDEIVAFSEIEKFIDTPVKWYSTGMYVRLAFSVAAHLEPEILMMDEVLAVGDAAFQQKCLDKMRAIRRHGRTIFFVSHNMPAVMRLCRRVLLIEQGEIVADGPPQSVVSGYLHASWKIGTTRQWSNPTAAPGDSVARLRQVRLVSSEGQPIGAADIRRPIGLEIVYEVLQPGQWPSAAIDLYNEEGINLFHSQEPGPDRQEQSKPGGQYRSTAWIPENLLAEGNLLASISLISGGPNPAVHAHEHNAVAFQAIDPAVEKLAADSYRPATAGVMRPNLRWTTQFAATGK